MTLSSHNPENARDAAFVPPLPEGEFDDAQRGVDELLTAQARRQSIPMGLSARVFEDTVGLCGAPIEDHGAGTGTTWQYLPDGAAVGIPFRSLVVRDATNVLVAGRCFSATHDAHASVRSMAQCMAMGQAAGTAAAMATRRRGDGHPERDGTIRGVDVGALQDQLRHDGAILELEAATAA